MSMPKSEEAGGSPRFYLLAFTSLVVAILYFAQEVLIPIALATLFSFLLGPLVTRLERWKLPRSVAVLVSVNLAFLLLVGVGYVVYVEIGELSQDLPKYKQNIHEKVETIRGPHGLMAWMHRATEVQKQLAPTTESTQQPPTPVRIVDTETSASQSTQLDLLQTVGGKLLGPLGTGLIVTVFTIFMLLQREDLRDRVIRLVGTNQLTMTTQALDDAAGRVSRYLIMQSIINGAVGVAVLLSLWTIGMVNHLSFPGVALWGLLAALLRFIPYVGIWIAAAMPILLSLAVFPHYRVALETIGAFVFVELIAANVFEPLLYGSSTGIATLAVLVAAIFWTWLWGPVGLLLSTPLTVCLVVMGKYVPQLEYLTILLGEEPALAPPDRLYQRLLAMDQEEAEELVDEYGKKMLLQELYDTVLVPTLTLAEVDLQRGTLDSMRHDAIQQGIRAIVDEQGDRARENDAKLEERLRPGSLPKGCVVKIVCLPASDAADETAAIMLGQLLELRGYCVMVGSMAQLASERVDTVANSSADVLCISSLPPAAITHARYLCKRMHEKLPDLEMIVGLWGTDQDLSRARERISFVKSVQIAGSFKQAIEQVLQKSQPKILSAASSSEH